MPLSSEQVYNELNGEECANILLARFQALLAQSPEFRRNVTLSRVQLNMMVHFEVAGRTPPTFNVTDDLIIRTNQLQLPLTGQEKGQGPIGQVIDREWDAQETINADTLDAAGQPPDLIREEHGQPVTEVVRGTFGMVDKEVVREGVKYAAFVKQDYGPMRERMNNPPPAHEQVIGAKSEQQPDRAGGGIQADFKDFVRKSDG